MAIDTTLTNMIAIISASLAFCLGLMYKVYEDFIFNYATKKNKTYDITNLVGEIRVGRFFIFIALWALLILFNMAIRAVAFSNTDYSNHAKITSIFYLGIVATTFIVIGIVPGLVEIFENTFGTFIVSTAPTSWLYKFENVIDVFHSYYFKQSDIKIPFTYLMPMFNLQKYDELFNAIKTQKGREEDASPSATVNDTEEKMVDFDFYFDFDKVCRDETDNKTAASEIFKQKLYKICLAKQNAGHFAWVYIASIVTILSAISAM
jgi:hypothetical protein